MTEEELKRSEKLNKVDFAKHIKEAKTIEQQCKVLLLCGEMGCLNLKKDLEKLFFKKKKYDKTMARKTKRKTSKRK